MITVISAKERVKEQDYKEMGPTFVFEDTWNVNKISVLMILSVHITGILMLSRRSPSAGWAPDLYPANYFSALNSNMTVAGAFTVWKKKNDVQQLQISKHNPSQLL